MTKEKILKKAEKILKKRVDERTCILAHVCINCGGNLTITGRCWNRWRYTCDKCNSIHYITL